MNAHTKLECYLTITQMVVKSDLYYGVQFFFSFFENFGDVTLMKEGYDFPG